MQPRQFPLPLVCASPADLERFHPGPNRAAWERVAEAALAGGILYLWGAAGSGKTHLLQGACHRAAQAGRRAAYLDLADPACRSEAALEGLERMDLVCLDGLEHVAGNRAWEGAALLLLDAAGRGGGVIAASRAPLAGLDLALPDLRSRLAWGGVYGLEPLADDELAEALRLHAEARGIELPREVARFLLARHPRRLDRLVDLLARLDRESLAAGRRLTLPFVRDLLGP
ncbi:DnaA regulatory inactivator Hda [Inmirania thermothiophila]|uniref:Regulatory inactivation of DnaA Hda protein n=1 Tax=Inmirania thermothiophila TaxID=1750597 RepID=A0A3N1Y8F2_9GAMM|nr:DnaA regulatory inactivator Hda [Inmirania thermothiophila]ROR35073.1 regulatory inactivation of DnaA Hda protein [Inmirania thermothiophila]